MIPEKFIYPKRFRSKLDQQNPELYPLEPDELKGTHRKERCAIIRKGSCFNGEDVDCMENKLDCKPAEIGTNEERFQLRKPTSIKQLLRNIQAFPCSQAVHKAGSEIKFYDGGWHGGVGATKDLLDCLNFHCMIRNIYMRRIRWEKQGDNKGAAPRARIAELGTAGMELERVARYIKAITNRGGEAVKSRNDTAINNSVK